MNDSLLGFLPTYSASPAEPKLGVLSTVAVVEIYTTVIHLLIQVLQSMAERLFVAGVQMCASGVVQAI